MNDNRESNYQINVIDMLSAGMGTDIAALIQIDGVNDNGLSSGLYCVKFEEHVVSSMFGLDDMDEDLYLKYAERIAVQILEDTPEDEIDDMSVVCNWPSPVEKANLGVTRFLGCWMNFSNDSLYRKW